MLSDKTFDAKGEKAKVSEFMDLCGDKRKSRDIDHHLNIYSQFNLFCRYASFLKR